MANMCDFSMKLVGKNENIEKFYKVLTQDGDIWMGRGGADTVIDKHEGYAFIFGWCKWSIQSAMIDDALSMQKQKESGIGNWYGIDKNDKHEYITLWEACRKFNLDMEAYSKESGCEFQEHYLFKDGNIQYEDCVKYYEYYIADYKNKKEAEKELGIQITNDEWENEEYICRGGFTDYEDFEI